MAVVYTLQQYTKRSFICDAQKINREEAVVCPSIDYSILFRAAVYFHITKSRHFALPLLN